MPTQPPSEPRPGAAGVARKTRREWFQDAAAAALTQGLAAAGAGDLARADEQLGRAHRIAPDDPSIALALATQRLRRGDYVAAVTLLEKLTQKHDVREAWWALAVARRGRQDHAGAAAALAHALSHHVVGNDVSLAGLVGTVAAAAGYPGWCGLHRQDRLIVAVARNDAVMAAFDGQTPRRVTGAGMPIPAPVRRIDVTQHGQPLLGSPILREGITRTEGVVWVEGDGLAGWAWHPRDPDTDVVLTVAPVAGGRGLRVVADDTSAVEAALLARPHRFRLAGPLPKSLRGPLRVTGPGGRALLGSPVDPMADFTALPMVPVAPAQAPLAPARPVAVVVPVYGGMRQTLECLASVFAAIPRGTRVIVVDDAGPEPALAQALDELQRGRRIRLLRHAANRGFPSAANTGMRAAMALTGRPDIVLLNSDTLVPQGWLEALRAVVQSEPDIGTATPFSNDATILSYPDTGRGNPVPADLAGLAALAARAANGPVDIPTAIGFCMYIRRECLAATGLFREDVFAQGYGEENDFCLRARGLGWRHVAAPGVFVAHLGGQSFGAARTALIARNLAVLERLHPGYAAGIAAFQQADADQMSPLALARRRLDMLRWRAARRPARQRKAVILVTHDMGGGVERVIGRRCEELRAQGVRPIVLRPVLATGLDPSIAADEARLALPDMCQIREVSGREPAADGFTNLRFRVPDELGMLAELLRGDRPAAMEVHHLLGHRHDVMRLADTLGIPLDMHLHDYAHFCPRITLVTVQGGARYCGEPHDVAACTRCVAEEGRRDEETIGVADLRARSLADFRRARRIVVPSNDMAQRIRRHFSGIVPDVVPLEDDVAEAVALRGPGDGPRNICVIGAIGLDKGYDVLLGCAQDAASRDLPLRFTVVGHTIDDDRLMQTGRVFVTGPYREAQAVALIEEIGADLAWMPSIWPETWSFTLALAWRAHLGVVAFDLGAPAERIRATGRGWLVPLGLSPPAINNTLLALKRDAGD